MASLLEIISDPLILIPIFMLLLYKFSTKTFSTWKKMKIPFVKPIPYFGNFGKFGLSSEALPDTLEKIYREFPDQTLVGYFQMREPVLMIREPKIISDILVKKFDHFSYRGLSKAFINTKNKKLNPLSGHLFTIDGERWKILRSKMSPTFTSGKLKQMSNQIEECIKEWLPLVGESANEKIGVDIRMLSAKLTTDVIGTCAFGLDMRAIKDPNSKFSEMGKKVFTPTVWGYVRFLLNSVNPKLIDYFRIPDLPSDAVRFYIEIVSETVKYRRSNEQACRPDYLQMMMELQNSTYDSTKSSDLESFDDMDIAANAFLFLVAGFETTALTMGYAILELALHQEVQDKLRKEICRECNDKITWEAAKKLRYLDMVIAETLRKYPPFPMLNRECTHSYAIPDTDITIPKGTMISVPVYSIHNDEKYFPNPEEYIPERFLEENKANIQSGTYLPFGDGPRYCIGARFAKMELKMALTELIKNYKFTPSEATQVPIKFNSGAFLLQPSDNIYVNVSNLV